MSETKNLVRQTIERLRAYASGNGIDPESIQLIKADEKTYDIDGFVSLRPDFHVETSSGYGRASGKGKKLFPSFLTMKEEIDKLRQAFEQGDTWLAAARAELEKEQGHGWGMKEADVTWDERPLQLAASENCPHCGGTGHTQCHECQGQATIICLFCEGRGQEVCTHCAGRGEDPSMPQRPCPVCNGKRFINCRYCQATGRVVCPTCHGKGYLDCPDCHGKGALLQESEITQKAILNFTFGSGKDLPSSLLRMIDRLGVANMGKGYVDIEIAAPRQEEAETQSRTQIRLIAHVPFADMKIQIGKKEHAISAFGKRCRLSAVPPFLDAALAPAFQSLAAAAEGKGSLEKALSARLMREALDLILSGKNRTNDLRSLYPVGLSGKMAETIVQTFDLAIKRKTLKMRALAALGFVAVSGALFAALLFSRTLQAITRDMSLAPARLLEILIPLSFMGGAWVALHHVTRWALKVKYPNAKISASQNIGKIGHAAVAAIGAVYVIFFLISESEWFAFLMKP